MDMCNVYRTKYLKSVKFCILIYTAYEYIHVNTLKLVYKVIINSFLLG